MSRGVNKVILIGNLGQDPDTRQLPSGKSVTNCSLATGESWNDKESGQKMELTEWHQLTFFGKIAELSASHLKQGSKIYVEGKIRTEKWKDKDGQDRYAKKIYVDVLEMLDRKPVDERPAREQKAAAPTASVGEFEDDIPF